MTLDELRRLTHELCVEYNLPHRSDWSCEYLSVMSNRFFGSAKIRDVLVFDVQSFQLYTKFRLFDESSIACLNNKHIVPDDDPESGYIQDLTADRVRKVVVSVLKQMQELEMEVERNELKESKTILEQSVMFMNSGEEG